MSQRNDIPKPVERGNFRLRMGSLYFLLKRLVHWYLSETRFVTTRLDTQIGKDKFNHVVAQHESLTMRELFNVDMWMQKIWYKT